MHHPADHYRRLTARAALLLTAAVGMLIAGGELLARLHYELQGPFNYDSPIYWAVGRGILNGLTPYADLFETKPPGIFLISSLSFALFDDITLTSFLQAVVLAAYPAVIVYHAWTVVRDKPRYTMIMALSAATLFSLVLALYVASRSGEFQVESFGALFGVLYACGLRHEAPGKTRTAYLASMILLSVGLKEPFILGCFAAALILYADSRDALRRMIDSFFVPAAIAGIAGAVLLLLLGYFQAYVGIYLPEMLGRHITAAGPLWQRGLAVDRLVTDMDAFSGAFLLSLALCAGLLLARGCSTHRPLRIRIQTVACLLLAVYALSIAVGAGGQYYDHHFVFAVPGYTALFVAFFQRLLQPAVLGGMDKLIGAGAVLVLTWAALFVPPGEYASRIQWATRDKEMIRTVAQRIDSLMDSCHLDRYLFIGQNGLQPYAFTKHSPAGPLFFQYEYLMNEQRPEFQNATMNNLYTAKFVVLQNYEFDQFTKQAEDYIKKHFSAYPWACAQPYANSMRYTFYYRNGQTGVAVRKKEDVQPNPEQ